jgi:hypothetical protein
MSHMLRDISASQRMRHFVAICARKRPHSTVALHRVRHRTDQQTLVAHTVSIALDHGGGNGCHQSGCAFRECTFPSGECDS